MAGVMAMALTNDETQKLSSILYQLEKLRSALGTRSGAEETLGIQQKLNDAGNILALVLTGDPPQTGGAAQ
jgi:hypothetical protein